VRWACAANAEQKHRTKSNVRNFMAANLGRASAGDKPAFRGVQVDALLPLEVPMVKWSNCGIMTIIRRKK
jgi:hypothetical protein